MEITIKKCSRKLAYEDAATLDEFWCQRQLENVIFRWNGKSFIGRQHGEVMQS